MRFAYQILIHTPLWVFPLFGYLVWQGIKAMRPRTTTIGRSLIVPAIFIIWGLSRLLSRGQDGVWPLLSWIAAAMALAPVGLSTAKPFKMDHVTGQITRPGSPMPFIRNVTIFTLQYTVAVIAAVDPEGRTTATLVGRAISGATTGYFLGRTIALLRQYLQRRKTDAKTSPPPR
jgi:hypothetical protein